MSLRARLDRAARHALTTAHPLDRLERALRHSGELDQVRDHLERLPPDQLEALDRAHDAACPHLIAFMDELCRLDLPDRPRTHPAWASVRLPRPTPDTVTEAQRELAQPEPTDATDRAVWTLRRVMARQALELAR